MKIILGEGVDAIEFLDFAVGGWVFWELVDWFGQVDDKVPVVERPQGHGAFPVAKSLRSSRAISYSAVYLAETVAEVEAAWDDLAAVGAEGPTLMRVVADSGDTQRVVSVMVSRVKDHNGDPTGEVAVDAIARDSRRYSVAQGLDVTGPPVEGQGIVWPLVWPLVWPADGSDGRIVLENLGKAPTFPTFTLTGGFDSATITCVETGQRIGFDRPVPVGSSVVIDVVTRTARIDGQSDVSRWLRFREWPMIPKESTRSFQFDVVAPVGSPTLTGEVRSAWW